jgi:TRAP-type C4-dicarboxylate transport system permease small subunit
VEALNKIKFVVDKVIEVISTIILAIMTVLVVYQVVTRYVFNAPSAISEILSQYLSFG